MVSGSSTEVSVPATIPEEKSLFDTGEDITENVVEEGPADPRNAVCGNSELSFFQVVKDIFFSGFTDRFMEGTWCSDTSTLQCVSDDDEMPPANMGLLLPPSTPPRVHRVNKRPRPVAVAVGWNYAEDSRGRPIGVRRGFMAQTAYS